MRALPPERAHRAAIAALRWGLIGGPRSVPDDPRLAVRLWGLTFANPVGLAAGFDKSAECFDRLAGLGFGFAEVGSVTPLPQAGNPPPRLFRLSEDEALINRMGFNNDGLERVAARLARRTIASGAVVLGVNLGKNKESPSAEADYELGIRRLAAFADYMVVNVSSPNTKDLRKLQAPDALSPLIDAVLSARQAAPARRPVLVKIAPDLDPAERWAIAGLALEKGIDGLIVSNTTTARPAGLKSRHRAETGGLSGRPLFMASTEALADLYRATGGALPLIGVGGIASGADAYAKIRAGASLVQLYTALVYQGPGLIGRIKSDLLARLAGDGFSRIDQAIGADHR